MQKKLITLFFLNLLIMLYSVSGILSKLAADAPVLSVRFCFYYAGVILLLGVYAIGWQQIIKRLPLTLAYASKALTVVWGLVWGVLFFRENITFGKLLGILLVVLGVIIYVRAQENE